MRSGISIAAAKGHVVCGQCRRLSEFTIHLKQDGKFFFEGGFFPISEAALVELRRRKSAFLCEDCWHGREVLKTPVLDGDGEEIHYGDE